MTDNLILQHIGRPRLKCVPELRGPQAPKDQLKRSFRKVLGYF